MYLHCNFNNYFFKDITRLPNAVIPSIGDCYVLDTDTWKVDCVNLPSSEFLVYNGTMVKCPIWTPEEVNNCLVKYGKPIGLEDLWIHIDAQMGLNLTRRGSHTRIQLKNVGYNKVIRFNVCEGTRTNVISELVFNSNIPESNPVLTVDYAFRLSSSVILRCTVAAGVKRIISFTVVFDFESNSVSQIDINSRSKFITIYDRSNRFYNKALNAKLKMLVGTKY